MQRLSKNSEINVEHGNLNYLTGQHFYTPAPAPVNTRSSICTTTATTLPQYQVLTATDNHLLFRPQSQLYHSFIQVQTAADNQQFDLGNSKELSYYVSSFLQ